MSEGTPGSLRDRNRARVIDVLRRQGTTSRAEIARLTGLSRSTVSSLVADLQRTGLVVEQPADGRGATQQGGRPPVLLGLGPAAGAVLGLDFGHGHLRVAVSDLSSRVLAERHRKLDVDHAAAESLDTAAALADAVLTEAGIDRSRLVAAGAGLPGPIDRGSGVVGSSVILPGWAGLRVRHELSRRLGLPVEVDNDANLGALGEATFGAGRGADDIVYLKIASGIGAGLILRGRLHRGATGIAGEIGHIQAARDGRLCRCGSRGCLETVAAVPSLLELLRETHGPELSVRDLVELAQRGDVPVRRQLVDAGRAVGRVLADLCNVLNPERVIVGGDLAATGDALLEGIRESLDRYALHAAAQAVTVTAGVLGERAEVLGALALAIFETNTIPTFPTGEEKSG